MSFESPRRILVVTDRTEPPPSLLSTLRARADEQPIAVRVLVPNPARAEVSLLHPERHRSAESAELALMTVLGTYERVAGGPVHTVVSVRHDPFEAVEEELFQHEADEIVVAMGREGELARRFHHDLPHRLAHVHLPVTVVDTAAALA